MAIIEMEAQLDQARVRLESMHQQLETKRSQAERGRIDPTEVQGVEANIRVLEIECRRLERQLDLLRARGEAPEPKEREGRSEFEHQLQLTQLEAQLEQAQVHLDQARRELQYKQELFEGNRIGQDEVEAAQTAVRTLEIEVERLNKQLEIIRQARDEG
jgi:multidrug resistance efflux pump